MSVRNKTMAVIALTSLGLILVLFGAARYVILRDSLNIEQVLAARAMKRLLGLLSERMSSLERFNLDLAMQHDTYNYVVDPTPGRNLYLFGEYGKNNPAARRLSFLLLFDSGGRIVAERKIYSTTGQSREIPASLRAQLTPSSLLLSHPDAQGSTSGIVMAPEGPLLVVSHAILRTDGAGPSRGTVVVGRFFDSYDLSALESLSGLKLTLGRIDQADLPRDFRQAYEQLPAGGSTYFRPAGDTNAWGYARIDDVYGRH